MQDYAVLYLLSTVFVLRDLYCTYRLVRMQTRLSCTYVFVVHVAVGTNSGVNTNFKGNPDVFTP